MARTLTIRGVSDAVLDCLRVRAAAGHRSLNSELLTILEAAAGSPRARASEARASEGTVREPAAAYAAEARDFLADVDLGALGDVCRHHHIRRLDVFGSIAERTARPDSDVDVIVEFEPGRTPGFDIVRVAEALRPVFGGRRVDLHTPYELRRLGDGLTSRTLYAAVTRHHLAGRIGRRRAGHRRTGTHSRLVKGSVGFNAAATRRADTAPPTTARSCDSHDDFSREALRAGG